MTHQEYRDLVSRAMGKAMETLKPGGQVHLYVITPKHKEDIESEACALYDGRERDADILVFFPDNLADLKVDDPTVRQNIIDTVFHEVTHIIINPWIDTLENDCNKRLIETISERVAQLVGQTAGNFCKELGPPYPITAGEPEGYK